MASMIWLTTQPMGKATMDAATKSQRMAFGFIKPAIPTSETIASTQPMETCPRRQIWFAARRRKNTSHAAANCRNTRLEGLVWMENMASVRLKCGEVLGLLSRRRRARKALFGGDEILQHDHVHFRGEETAQGVAGRADDGFTAHVETRIHQHGTAGVLLEY